MDAKLLKGECELISSIEEIYGELRLPETSIEISVNTKDGVSWDFDDLFDQSAMIDFLKRFLESEAARRTEVLGVQNVKLTTIFNCPKQTGTSGGG